MNPRPELRLVALLRSIAIVALVLLTLPARAALGAAQCGSQALTLDDLKTLARDVGLAGRVAPHSPDVRDEAMRAAFESLRERTAGGTTASRNLASADGEGWQPGFGLPGLHEYPAAAVEYHGELVVSGWLYTAGTKSVLGIARWTDNGWAPLGEGIVPGFALAVMNDRLYAGEWPGSVAVWDGQSWTHLPPSPLMNLRALVVHDGELYVAGSNGTHGRVARFDGQAWQILGGDFDDDVAALGFYHGDLIAGGRFRNYQGIPTGYVARWNGTTWESIGSGIDSNNYSGVSAIEEFGDRLIVGGWFESCGYVPSPGLAAWDGTSWSALEGAPAAYVNDLMVMNDKLYIAGSFAGDYAGVAQWDGTTWTSQGIEQWVLGLTSYHGQLTAVGGFYGAGCPSGKRITGVATLGADGWSGYERWEPTMHGLADNAGAALLSSAVIYHGDLVVAGTMGLAGNPPEWKPVSSPVRWDGQSWQSMDDGSPCPMQLAVVGSDLIGGGFSGIARWDGAAWHPMGSGLSGLFLAITEYQGKVYAGGELQIGATGESATLASFDGIEWSKVPSAPDTARVNTARVAALEVVDGLLYVGGNFEGAGNVASRSIVAWDGNQWRAVGGGVNGEIEALESYHGELIAGGMINPDPNGYGYEGTLRWNGSTWTSMGLANCQVTSLGRYGEKLVIGGNQWVDRFIPGGTLGLVTWEDGHWGSFGTGVVGQVRAIQQVEGDLYVAGTFGSAGDQSAFSVARWAGSEPPTVQPSPLALSLAVGSTVVTSSQAQLSFSVPEAGRVRLELYDARGARVALLRDGDAATGRNVLAWSSGSPAPFPQNGVYFLRLTAGGKTANGKVVFAR